MMARSLAVLTLLVLVVATASAAEGPKTSRGATLKKLVAPAVVSASCSLAALLRGLERSHNIQFVVGPAAKTALQHWTTIPRSQRSVGWLLETAFDEHDLEFRVLPNGRIAVLQKNLLAMF